MVAESTSNILLYIQNELLAATAQIPKLTWLVTAEILLAITCAALAIWLLNKSAALISKTQRKLYQSKLSYNSKNKLGKILKPFKPNAAWLFALLLAEIANPYFEDRTLFKNFFFEPLFLYVIYKLILLSSNYSIESAYTSTNKFISKSVLDTIHKQAQYFSLYTTLFFIPLAYKWWELLAIETYVLIFIACWLSITRLYYAIIDAHKITFIKFISKQVPGDSKEIELKLSGVKSKALLLLLLVIAHLIKGTLKIHEILLLIAPYRKITAKLLRIRLEQKQSAVETSEEAVIDERYELWFSQHFQASEIIATKNSEYFNQELNDILESWLHEKISENDLLVRGDAGIGKTTLIKNWIQHSPHKDKTHYIEVPPKGYTTKFFLDLIAAALNTSINSIDELVAFDKSSPKHIFVLDNCENFFLSTIGGFDCFKAIFSILNLPLRNIFWVFVIGNESYTYLNDVFGRLNQYSFQMVMKPWKSEEIRELIMSRHNASKRKLAFDDLLFSSIGNSDELSSYSATADRCFLLLAEQSHGNPSLALSTWIKASSKKEKFTIEIGLPETPSTSFLNDYNADLLFIYASLIKHKSLTISEAAESTRQNHSVAQRAFKLGIDHGFLYSDNNGRFYMHMYWQAQMISFLRIKNHLHGI